MEHRKAALVALKTELLARNERTHEHIHNRQERISANFADQSQELDNQELVLNVDAEGRQEVALIDAALKRIDADLYGKCTSCGEEISEARLDAVPYTAHCMSCARDQE